MAYNSAQFTKLANLNPSDTAQLQRSRQVFVFNAGADTMATVAAAGYFNSIRNLVEAGDLIQVIFASDKGFGLLKIAAAPATGNVTTASVQGVARGRATTVTASDTIVTGLPIVALVLATLDDDPVATCSAVTATIGDQAGTPAAGSFLLKSWMPTDATHPVLIAATTFVKKVNWVAYAAAGL